MGASPPGALPEGPVLSLGFACIAASREDTNRLDLLLYLYFTGQGMKVD